MKILAPAVLLLLATTALASDQTWKNASLVDAACSAKVKDAPDSHTTSCAIGCEKSGYGIIAADGSFLKFDDAGNKRALAALKATKKTDHLRATVVGERDGETIKVKSISLD